MTQLVTEQSVGRGRKTFRTAGWALGMLAVLLLAVTAVVWRSPVIARTLPEADAVVYADLRPLRLLTHFDQHPVAHSADYQHFMDETGIVPERDLTRAAFALHRMPEADGPNGAVGYSEIFEGHFDPERLARYLGTVSSARESYSGHEIFQITVTDANPHGVRLVRVAVLSAGLVAASNMPTAEQIHSILDRARTPALLRSGPLVLGSLYSRVPWGAGAWGVGELALPFADTAHVSAFGLQLPIVPRQPIVASLRYTTSLHLRLELLGDQEATAAAQSQALSGMLSLARALVTTNGSAPVPAPVAAAMASITVRQEGDRTVMGADLPTALVRTLAGVSP